MKFFNLIFLLFPLAASSQEEVIPLRLSSIVEVSPKQTYFLSDIFESARAHEMGEIRVPWKIPKVLSREEVYEALKGVLSQTGQTYSLDIPAQIQFVVSEHSISEKEMQRKIRNQLVSLCSDCRFQIKLSKLPRMESSDWTVDFSSLKEKGSFSLPMSRPGLWISGMVRTEKPVLVLRKPLRRDERVTKEHVRKDFREITFINDALMSEEDVLEMKARRDLAVGSVVLFQNLVRESAAQKGSMVRIITGSSLFEISTQGIAEAQGQVGDTIPLRLMDSKKVISGEIVEKGLVKIQ